MPFVAHLEAGGARAHVAAQEAAQLRLPRVLPRHRHNNQMLRRRRRQRLLLLRLLPLLLPLFTAVVCYRCDGRLTLCITCRRCQEEHLVWPPVRDVLHRPAVDLSVTQSTA
jgi:hypothetical protein